MARIMGIINVTPDSFWSGSRVQDRQTLAERVRQMISQGADAIDIGGCSTRPGSAQPTEEEEMERLSWGLDAIRGEFPDILLSVDTYRPRIASRCVKEWKADIINDVYGGDSDMYGVVAETGARYILTCAETVRQDPVAEMIPFFEERLNRLERAGVDVEKKVILDPGFGFGKTVEQNFTLLANLEKLRVRDLPLLVGVSRKSMAWRLLGITPQECLPATVAMNTVALMGGADWIRVHDVLEAVHADRIINAVKENK